ncbi:DUF3052 family protein [Actinomyces vulturis]|uniref:DUF3052 family protein n=1 Tax=Actinomyces vulturis TaxID=1857645 RepID=UPI00082C54EF|nr:DUF3052 family protein [Actinomyces vulturis]
MASKNGGTFGFTSGQVVQEFGFDDDVDETLRTAISQVTGCDLVDEDYDDVVDGALIWWRDDDGDVDDLIDVLVDAQANLDGAGFIWVLSPKARTEGAIDPFMVEEAAQISGMHATSAAAMGDAWSGIRIQSGRRA